jgi:hypothetical protein
MKIEVHYRNGHYYWVLFDGPDGCDQYEGIASCLGECMEEIVKKRMENAQFYGEKV